MLILGTNIFEGDLHRSSYLFSYETRLSSLSFQDLMVYSMCQLSTYRARGGLDIFIRFIVDL